MNYTRKLRKIRNNAKALSPVVASIILIAVTVAVSVAVAAWMGGLTGSFMQTEELKITGVSINEGTATISVSNTGTSSVTINQVFVGSTQITNATESLIYTGISANGALSSNKQGTIAFNYEFVSGNNYQIKVVTAKGTSFQYSAIAGPT